MYCKNCGKEINDNADYCINCGKAVNPIKQESNTLAIVGFILSFFVSIAGLICSIVGYRKAANGEADGKGLALAGIIISAIRIAFELIIIIFYISMFIAFITASVRAPQAMLTLTLL